MNDRKLIYKVILAGAAIIASLHQVSCDRFREDLPQCRLEVAFKYDYNVKSVCAFHEEVKKVDLYVFDADGKFLFVQSGEGAPLATGNYRMELEVPVGRYKLMAWATTGDDDSYEIAGLTPGSSSIEDVKLKLKRGASPVIDREIDALWYGEILDIHFTGTRHQTETINLIKDTNKIRFAFIGNNMAQLKLEDYTYEIIGANGYLGHDNALLADDVLSYRPYYSEQRNASSVLVEMNTMRLMASGDMRFVVTRKSDSKKVLDFNLTDYLVLTKMEGHAWGEQEYLDRQDEYAIALIFSECAVNELWLAVQITINGWTCYLQEEDEDKS